MLADCLVKPREFSHTAPYLLSLPNRCCIYHDASSGTLDSLCHTMPLHSSSSSLLSLLLRTFFPFNCRTPFASASFARSVAAKARQSSAPIVIELRLSCLGVK